VGVTATDMTNTLAVVYNYQPTIRDPQNPLQQIPNPMSKAEFVRLQVGRLQMEAYRRQKQADVIAAAIGGITPAGDLT